MQVLYCVMWSKNIGCCKHLPTIVCCIEASEYWHERSSVNDGYVTETHYPVLPYFVIYVSVYLSFK